MDQGSGIVTGEGGSVARSLELSHSETMEDLASDDLVFQIGVAPNRIDILTDIGSLSFEKAWTNRVEVPLWGRTVPVIRRDELIQAKRRPAPEIWRT